MLKTLMAKGILDLHGFKGEDILDAVDRFILDVNNKGLTRARIMTGKGNGIVKKIVIQYLANARYPWAHEKTPNGKDNEGVVIVFLD